MKELLYGNAEIVVDDATIIIIAVQTHCSWPDDTRNDLREGQVTIPIKTKQLTHFQHVRGL